MAWSFKDLSHASSTNSTSTLGDGFGLYPFGELVDRYEQVSEAARALFEGSYHVEALDRKWPGDGMV